MSNLRKYFSKVAFLIAAMPSTLAFSAVIQFTDVTPEGQRSDSNAPYSEAGYTLTPFQNGLFFTSSTFQSPFLTVPTGGSDYMSIAAVNGNSGFRLKRSDNQLFSLASLDVSYESFGSDSFQIAYKLAGQKSDYSTFNYSFSLISDRGRGTWHTFSFIDNPDFSNLRELSITSVNPRYESGSVDLGAAFDNIVVSEVPVPASAWLLGSGLLSLVSFRKKN